MHFCNGNGLRATTLERFFFILAAAYAYATAILAVLQAVKKRDYRRKHEVMAFPFRVAGILALNGDSPGCHVPVPAWFSVGFGLSLLVGFWLAFLYWLAVWHRYMAGRSPHIARLSTVCLGFLMMIYIDGYGGVLADLLPLRYARLRLSLGYSILHAPILAVLVVRVYPGLHRFTYTRKTVDQPRNVPE